jgi:hypothetical protein
MVKTKEETTCVALTEKRYIKNEKSETMICSDNYVWKNLCEIYVSSRFANPVRGRELHRYVICVSL